MRHVNTTIGFRRRPIVIRKRRGVGRKFKASERIRGKVLDNKGRRENRALAKEGEERRREERRWWREGFGKRMGVSRENGVENR